MSLSVTTSKNRWALVNKRTLNIRRSTATRAAARNAKRPTERILDTLTDTYVR